MGLFTKELSYEDKAMDRVLGFTDVAIELAEKIPNASNIRVDSYGINLTFFKPHEKVVEPVTEQPQQETVVG